MRSTLRWMAWLVAFLPPLAAGTYERAARMQPAAFENVDLSGEPQLARNLYGIGEAATDDFGRQPLLARRLSEQGAGFVQVCHAGGGNGGWDAHGDIETQSPLCRATDRPIARLIRDLKQHGMLDQTLIVWFSDVGRSPWSQHTTKLDHNPRGYTAWIAGGGVKGGVVHASTADFGYNAFEDRHYDSDLHATIL